MKPNASTAVLFDLDGTLLDTLDDIADSTNRVLSQRGFPVHPVDAYRYLVGDGVTVLLTRALPEDRRDPATLETCIRAYHAEYAAHWNHKTKLYAGVHDMLDALHGRGVPIAVLSNKPHAFTVQCVEHYLSQWKFEVVLGQREGIPRKPDPAGALEIARRMGTDCAHFAYVGDTATDMQTATAAGMWPVGVLWGFRPRQELEQTGAKTIIARPMDLLRSLAAAPSPSSAREQAR
jgi:phosphoglycolate phosphatase